MRRSSFATGEGVVLAALLVFAAIPASSPTLGIASSAAVAAATVQLVRVVSRLGVRRSFLATLLGILPTLPVITVFHEQTNGAGSTVTRLALFVFWSGFALSLGVPLARRAVSASGALVFGGLTSTGFFAMPLMLLLLPGASAARRLQLWTGEIDNSVFVAVARGVIAEGPRAGGAGTGRRGFAIAPDALLSLVGHPGFGGVDVRLAAVDLVLLAAVSAIVVTGLSSAVALALLSAQLGNRRGSQARGGFRYGLEGSAQFLMGLLGTGVVLIVASIAPLRTGFLTFAWGFSWVALAFFVTLLAHLEPSTSSWSAAAVSASAAAWMALATHPTAVPAALLIAGFAILRVALELLRRSPRLRRHGVLPLVLIAGLLATAALVALLLVDSRAALPALAADALSEGGAGIAVDGPFRNSVGLVLIAWGASLTWAILRRRRLEGSSREHLVALHLAPIPVGGFLTVLIALNWLGQEVDGASSGYFSRKAAYAVAASILVFGVLHAFSHIGLRPIARAAALVSLTLVFSTSAVTEGARSWWFWSTLADQPHAVTVVAAIEATNPDVSIRCRPDPTLVVDWQVREAAHACIAWPETAFNTDTSSRDPRSDVLTLRDGDTLSEVVEQLDDSSWFFVAYVFPMETGWFGWTRGS